MYEYITCSDDENTKKLPAAELKNLYHTNKATTEQR